jgi:hypothetical protein
MQWPEFNHVPILAAVDCTDKARLLKYPLKSEDLPAGDLET